MNSKDKYKVLPSGAIKPDGWLRRQLLQDLESGFAGHLDELTTDCTIKVFQERLGLQAETVAAGMLDDNPGQKWYPGEFFGNWLDGFLRMALLTQNPEALKKAFSYVDALLLSQDNDGYIGIYSQETRYRHVQDNAELFAQSRVLLVLSVVYEATGDAKYLDAVKRAVDLTITKYGDHQSYFTSCDNFKAAGGTAHGLLYIEILAWLFDETRDEKYKDFGLFLYNDYCDARVMRDKDNSIDHLQNMDRPHLWHTPHTVEHARIPLWIYTVTGSEKYLQAYRNSNAKTMYHALPSGVCLGDEQVMGRAPHPELTYEYCSITEQLISTQWGARITGDVDFADQVETIIFNAAQGARLADGTAISYLTPDNRYSAVKGFLNGKLGLSPTHRTCCCNPMATRIMPHFIQQLWLTDSDKSELTAMYYGPCNLETIIKAVKVSITEKTYYPFDESVKLIINPEKEVEFSIRLRIPGWSHGYGLEADGCAVREEGDFVILNKKWKAGDTVEFRFNAKVEEKKAANGEFYITRGPLVFALEIPSERHVTKKYDVPGFYDYDCLPKPGGLWNYAFVEDQHQAVSHYGIGIERRPNYAYPWFGYPIKIRRGMVNLCTGREEYVEFVPIGTTVLRRVTFMGGSYRVMGCMFVPEKDSLPLGTAYEKPIESWKDEKI